MEENVIYQEVVENATFEENSRGVKIKKCCASCAHKVIDDRFVRSARSSCRLCKLNNITCTNKSLCGKWTMSESLKDLGKGDGEVKNIKYLEWLCNESYRRRMLVKERGFKPGTPAYNEVFGDFDRDPRKFYKGEIYIRKF